MRPAAPFSRRARLAAGLLVLGGALIAQAAPTGAPQDYRAWSTYGGDPGQTHYSSLDQINRENVGTLQRAWAYDAGDGFGEGALGSEMQCNPIVVGDRLFLVTPTLRVVALDAAHGAELWSFDPNEGRRVRVKRRSRGVAHGGDDADARIYFGAGHFLYSLHADTGRADDAFGDAGRIDLRIGLDRPAAAQSVFLTSPPVVHGDLVIVGGAVAETLPSSPGYIRAYDRRDGSLRWVFRTLPAPGERGRNSWPGTGPIPNGGANNWAGMTLDAGRGLLFVPTGSAAFDFYGGDRVGDNLFANTLLALEVETGRRVWSYQVVRHDLWDRDLPAPPVLASIQLNGRQIDVVVQVTKSGHTFVLDRDTGRPVFPVDEIPVPQSDVPGEVTARTQRIPRQPQPFAQQALGEPQLTTRTPAAHRAVIEAFRELRYRGPFDPPSQQGTLILPGLDGGANWGGPALNPGSAVLFVNASEMAWILRLKPRPVTEEKITGASLYRRHCADCHGGDPRGVPTAIVSLAGIAERMSRQEVTLAILTGGTRMPAFAGLGMPPAEAIAEYLISGREVVLSSDAEYTADHRDASGGIGLPFFLDGYQKFLDPDGYPAISPPWGSLTAIDLATGRHLWRVPLGFYPELAAQGMPDTGSENYGGPVVTAGGLVFIGATVFDNRFRAFDSATGRLLWETGLPAAAHATPAVYEVDGRQFVVIAAGGGKNPHGRSAALLIAYALPDDESQAATD